MSSTRNWASMAAMIAASFVGGGAYQALFGAPRAALAQATQPPAQPAAPAVPAVLRARSFSLVDADGNERARLGSVPGGGTGLVLLDKQGRPRVALGCAADGAITGLTLMDADGKDRALLGTDAKDGVTLHLSAQEDKARVEAGVAADGDSARYLLFGADGKEVAGIRTGSTGTGFGLTDAAGDERITIKLGADGAPALRAIGEAGKEKWHAP